MCDARVAWEWCGWNEFCEEVAEGEAVAANSADASATTIGAGVTDWCGIGGIAIPVAAACFSTLHRAMSVSSASTHTLDSAPLCAHSARVRRLPLPGP